MTGTDDSVKGDLPLTGSCMCGAVRFEVSEPLVEADRCYCTRCQKRTGNGYSASALARAGSFRVTAGADRVKTFAFEDGWLKAFCKTCGGHLYAADRDDPTQIAVRLGAFDSDPGIRPSDYYFTDYAAAWSPVPDDGVTRHPEGV